jgi:hypothetical protein
MSNFKGPRKIRRVNKNPHLLCAGWTTLKPVCMALKETKKSSKKEIP